MWRDGESKRAWAQITRFGPFVGGIGVNTGIHEPDKGRGRLLPGSEELHSTGR